MNDSIFKTNSTFVSERISKIRFIESDNCLEPDLFVSASSESIKLWKLYKNEFSDEIECDLTPKSVAGLQLDGSDITGLEIADHNNVVASVGSGVSCVWINRDMEKNNLRVNHRFNNLHKFKTGDPALCTGVSIHGDSLATIGEDGRVTILSLSGQKLLLDLENVDSVTQTAVNFINYKELLTGNRLGIMKSYDLRTGAKEATTTFPISCEDEKKSNGVTCIANHPTQQHIVSNFLSTDLQQYFSSFLHRFLRGLKKARSLFTTSASRVILRLICALMNMQSLS